MIISVIVSRLSSTNLFIIVVLFALYICLVVVVVDAIGIGDISVGLSRGQLH